MSKRKDLMDMKHYIFHNNINVLKDYYKGRRVKKRKN